MKHLLKILFTVTVACAAIACVNQDADYTDCEQGIRLLFDFIDPAAVREGTTTLNVAISGDNADMDITSPVAGRDLDILPGEYRFTAWETAANITRNGTVVTLASTRAVAAEPQPFTAGTTTDRVLNTEEYQEVHIPMYQQTRDLIIRLRFTGDGVSLIRSATGIVSGITLSRDITFGFPPVDGRIRPQGITDGTIEYSFALASDGWYTGRKTLLGIDGDSDQIFTVTVGFDEGQYTTDEIELTSDFNGFHTVNVDEPWVISLTLDVGLTFEMDIIDWNSGAESWLEAE